MATFIMNALNHTNLRPAGLTAQTESGTAKVTVSMRDAEFKPVVNAMIDAVQAYVAHESRAFKDDGTAEDRLLDWSDEEGVFTSLTLTVPETYLVASSEGTGVRNRAEAHLTDQFGPGTRRGESITFTSSDPSVTPNNISRNTNVGGNTTFTYHRDSATFLRFRASPTVPYSSGSRPAPFLRFRASPTVRCSSGSERHPRCGVPQVQGVTHGAVFLQVQGVTGGALFLRFKTRTVPQVHSVIGGALFLRFRASPTVPCSSGSRPAPFPQVQSVTHGAVFLRFRASPTVRCSSGSGRHRRCPVPQVQDPHRS